MLSNLSQKEILNIVRKWGNCSSDAVLDPKCSIFSKPNVEGFIGYRAEKNCFIVYGDPVCSPIDLEKLTKAFHSYAQDQKASIIYLVTSASFKDWSLENGICKAAIECGEELSIDPSDDPRDHTGVSARLVRRKCRHAEHEGTSAYEYLEENEEVKQQIEDVGVEWLINRKGLQIHISNIFLFDNKLGKRWFYAKKNQKVVGVLVLNRLESRQGWLFNHLMFTKDAPGGTPELLVVSALETLGKENCHYVTFGAVPTQKIGQIIGFGAIGKTLVHLIYQISVSLFHLKSRKMFWEKFQPASQKSYLLFSNPHLGFHELIALKNALNVGFI